MNVNAETDMNQTQELCEEKKEVQTSESKFTRGNQLFKACSEKNVQAVLTMLSEFDENQKDVSTLDTFFEACKTGLIPIFDRLQQRVGKYAAEVGFTKACEYGQIGLIHHCISLDIISYGGGLIAAAQGNQREVADLLIAQGAWRCFAILEPKGEFYNKLLRCFRKNQWEDLIADLRGLYCESTWMIFEKVYGSEFAWFTLLNGHGYLLQDDVCVVLSLLTQEPDATIDKICLCIINSEDPTKLPAKAANVCMAYNKLWRFIGTKKDKVSICRATMQVLALHRIRDQDANCDFGRMCASGKRKRVREYLKTAPEKDRVNGLRNACGAGQVAIVKLFFKHAATTTHANGVACLEIACLHNRMDIVDLLVSVYGIKCLPHHLLAAAKGGNIAIVKFIVARLEQPPTVLSDELCLLFHDNDWEFSGLQYQTKTG
jgi:hypothetical protein